MAHFVFGDVDPIWIKAERDSIATRIRHIANEYHLNEIAGTLSILMKMDSLLQELSEYKELPANMERLEGYLKE